MVATPVGDNVREEGDVAIGDIVELVSVLAVAVLAADPEVVEVGPWFLVSESGRGSTPPSFI